MKFTTEQLTEAISTWINTDLIPRSSLVQQGVITFCLLQGKKKLESMLSIFTELDPDSDVEEFFKNLCISLDKMGGYYEIPIINYRLDKQDLLKIKDILNERA